MGLAALAELAYELGRIGAAPRGKPYRHGTRRQTRASERSRTRRRSRRCAARPSGRRAGRAARARSRPCRRHAAPACAARSPSPWSQRRRRTHSSVTSASTESSRSSPASAWRMQFVASSETSSSTSDRRGSPERAVQPLAHETACGTAPPWRRPCNRLRQPDTPSTCPAASTANSVNCQIEDRFNVGRRRRRIAPPPWNPGLDGGQPPLGRPRARSRGAGGRPRSCARLAAVVSSACRRRSTICSAVMLVVAVERLGALERLDAREHAAAVAVAPLVGGDGAQLVLAEAVQALDDLVGGEVVVAGDRQVALAGRRAADLALDGLRAGDAAGLLGACAPWPRRAGRALAVSPSSRTCRPRRSRSGRRSASRRPAPAPSRASARGSARAGRRACAPPGRGGGRRARRSSSSPIAARRRLERVVGRDLERLGRALVLGVLEQLLLAAAAAQQVDRALGEREHLADEGLGPGRPRPTTRPPPAPRSPRRRSIARGVPAGLAQVALEQPAVAAARRHRDVGLKRGDQRRLGGVGLLEVLRRRARGPPRAGRCRSRSIWARGAVGRRAWSCLALSSWWPCGLG